MSLLSNSASCGTSNSVQKLSGFATSSIANDYNTALHASDPRSFGSNHMTTHDPRLEQEFRSFTATSSHIGKGNISLTAVPGLVNNAQYRQTKQAASSQLRNSEENAWISEFSRIQLTNPLHSTATQQTHQPQQFFQQQQRPISQNYVPMMRNLTEHQQVHRMQSFPDDDALFEQAFSTIEQEIAGSETGVTQHSDNVLFSEIAAKIAGTMEASQENKHMESKFKQSNFLKLMTSISSKQIGLSESGNGLVDTATGSLINTPELAPESTLTASEVAPESTLKASEGALGLPDPLSFLEPGDTMESSDQLRNIINQRIAKQNGEHIPPYSVEDISRDYQHEDDMF